MKFKNHKQHQRNKQKFYLTNNENDDKIDTASALEEHALDDELAELLNELDEQFSEE